MLLPDLLTEFSVEMSLNAHRVVPYAACTSSSRLFVSPSHASDKERTYRHFPAEPDKIGPKSRSARIAPIPVEPGVRNHPIIRPCLKADYKETLIIKSEFALRFVGTHDFSTDILTKTET